MQPNRRLALSRRRSKGSFVPTLESKISYCLRLKSLVLSEWMTIESNQEMLKIMNERSKFISVYHFTARGYTYCATDHWGHQGSTGSSDL